MEIEITESTMVRPAQETPRRRLWLSNLDLVMRTAHNQGLNFYKPNGSCNFFDPQKLKEALSETLVTFYPMAGRLVRDENDRIEIDCNEGGVLFVVAKANCAMDDIDDFILSASKLQLIPGFDYSGDISSYPIAVAQVTFFKCGGVCLGTGHLHQVVDGASAMHYINSWADTTCGKSIRVIPFLDRTLLAARIPLTPMFDHEEYKTPPALITPPQTRKLQSCPTGPTYSTKILNITLDQLNTLKTKAQTTDRTTKFSTYETLTAHIWRCMCKARGLSNDQPTSLYIATDGRFRLDPPLPQGYFGNVIFTTVVTRLSGEIQSEPLANTMEKIHEAVKRRDSEYLRSALDYLEEQPDLTALARGGNICKSPNLTVANWTRLPVHDADFGWGRPIYMGPAKVSNEGRVLIMRNSGNDDGTLSIVLLLEARQMQIFEKYLYDFDFSG